MGVIRRHAAFRAIAVAVGALTIWTACGAGWHQPERLPSSLPQRQQVRVWHQGGMARWHGVIVTADSVSGIHWRQPVSCDTCRVTLPCATVDSLQLGNPMRGFWRGVGITAGILGVITYITCRSVPCG